MLIALLMLAGQDPPRVQVIETLRDAEAVRAGIKGEVLLVPVGTDAPDFAERLIANERLKPWSPDDPGHGESGEMGYRAVHTGDGREVTVFFALGVRGRGHVCRLRRSKGGVSEGWWRARHWCAGHFLADDQLRPGPPFRDTTEIPRSPSTPQ